MPRTCSTSSDLYNEIDIFVTRSTKTGKDGELRGIFLVTRRLTADGEELEIRRRGVFAQVKEGASAFENTKAS